MATKTLTITEDAYNMLASNKMKDESFSEVLKRILSKRKTKTINNFFGTISEKEGTDMLSDLEMIRRKNIEKLNERIS